VKYNQKVSRRGMHVVKRGTGAMRIGEMKGGAASRDKAMEGFNQQKRIRARKQDKGGGGEGG